MLKAFLAGAAGYPALELLFRRRTHYSMAVAGGLSAMLVRKLSRTPVHRGVQAGLCGAGITAIEWGCGQIWNRDYQVWDYRRTPLNWRGQVCLPYTLLWCGLSACMLPILDQSRRATQKTAGQSR